MRSRAQRSSGGSAPKAALETASEDGSVGSGQGRRSQRPLDMAQPHFPGHAPQAWLEHQLCLCPQLVDPYLDHLAYVLLRRLKAGTHVHTGMRESRARLDRPRLPLVLIACTNAGGHVVAHHLADIRGTAAALGVPVVHALSRRLLAEACGLDSGHLLTVVAVEHLPAGDSYAMELLTGVLDRAARASAAYMDFQLSGPLGPLMRLAIEAAVAPPSVPSLISATTV